MKSLELFAGIGGIALAAEWAGIETIAFCEREPFCQKVLKKHWPDVPIFDDIRDLNKNSLIERGVDIGTIELISGGFPCQPYSIAGKRKGKEDDRDLWPEMFRVIQEIRPTWIVGENVANFANMELERTLSDLEGEGYETQTFIIPACSVNAKHRRDRIFLVSHSNSKRPQRGKKRASNKTTKQQLERLLQTNIWDEISSSRDYRNVNGIPQRMDRLRALGNAVVPQQIYPILKAIAEVHREGVKP